MRPPSRHNFLLLLAGFLAAFFLSSLPPLSSLVEAQEIDDCMMCHEDEELTKVRDGREVSLFFDLSAYERSIHGQEELVCIDCHADLDGADFPHEEELELVDCSLCHDDIAELYMASLHGQAIEHGEKLAPHCWDCHTAHDILPAGHKDSQVAKFNIPFMCGRCHKEGTPVTRTYDIPQDSILTHYSLSIHGEGLFQQGLTITAVCSDCHTAHNVLPHTDPNSTIYPANVPATCQQCHGRIEEVHTKVIRGELWEREPHKVPICSDCHSPHEVRRPDSGGGVSTAQCLSCHARPDLVRVQDGDTISLFVDPARKARSAHKDVACAQCHTDVNPFHPERSCATITQQVDCSICHAEVVDLYNHGTHGKLFAAGDLDAPSCLDCHSVKCNLSHEEPASPIHPAKVPDLCGRCHRADGPVARRDPAKDQGIIASYTMSIHGKGLLESGLLVTAQCTNCHTAHHVLPADDPSSSVNSANIPDTCGKCHGGIFDKFSQSIHFLGEGHDGIPLPMCADCHTSHTISRTDQEGFKQNILNTCGKCHIEEAETYFDTYHGKVSKLGYTATAQCFDCHGDHDILKVTDPDSHLSRKNVVATCGACHEGSHRQFAGYLTHATHHDRDKYPFLFYTFWSMTGLLIFTFALFGTHTLMWLPRSWQMMKQHSRRLIEHEGGKHYRRFNNLHRRLHILVIISFLSLAVTGMTLKFSYLGWAQWLARVLGGFQTAGYIHRIGAIITFVYFGIHLFDLARRKVRSGKSLREFLTGPYAMLPNRQDWHDLVGTVKWFIGMGSRPSYGHWTYWEKFDYFAVFWGVAMIGMTGLMLWFPEFFTRFLPGWFINVATVIHSDEALLAVGFIFTIHFFNTHFRPDRFPMDTVIFTGTMPLEEFKIDRPREYEELVRKGELDKHLVDPPSHTFVKGAKIFGGAALITGILLILLIIWAELFGYR
jgi:cytochrome b subunit of formate dehydrogenase